MVNQYSRTIESAQSMNVQGDLMAQEQSTASPQMGCSSNIAARPQLVQQLDGPRTLEWVSPKVLELDWGWAGLEARKGLVLARELLHNRLQLVSWWGVGNPRYHKMLLVNHNNSQHLVLILLQTWTFWVDVQGFELICLLLKLQTQF